MGDLSQQDETRAARRDRMRNELRSLLNGHLSKLVDQRGQTERLLEQDRSLPAKERERDRQLISRQIKEMKTLLEGRLCRA